MVVDSEHAVTFAPVRKRAITGRPKISSIGHLEKVAVELFTQNGYQQTTIDDVAAAAQVSRRTVFRYVSTKNQLLWLYAADHISELKKVLEDGPQGHTMVEFIQDALVKSMSLQRSETEILRKKLKIIQANDDQLPSALAYRLEAAVLITRAIHRELPNTRNTLAVNAIGHAYLAAAFEALSHWAATEDGADGLKQAMVDIFVPLNLAYEPYLQDFS